MKRLFPQVKSKPAERVNLDSEARHWAKEHPKLFSPGVNPLVEPGPCQKMVDDTHRRLGVEWSWGSYLENRSFLWQHTYLEESGDFIHAGVDLNLPAGLEVSAPIELEVVLTHDDHPVNWGWGPRIFAAPSGAAASVKAGEYIFIFAHLEAIRVKKGDKIKAGAVMAQIGRPPFNGNWYTHVHIQAVERNYFSEIQKLGLEKLDGYFNPKDLERMSKLCPEPLSLLGLA